MNEVACTSMISSNYFDIPVPKVYAFATEAPRPFVIQEYVDGEVLSSLWNRYNEEEKRFVAHQLADIIIQMGEIRFDGIGSFTGDPGGSLGPTVEGSKIFKGRASS